MAWIRTIDFDEATGRLRELFDGIAGRRNRIDNILSVHSLRPHTLAGHLALYKSVLHHTGNTLPVWFLETLGVLVSKMNGCSYCVAHHAAGLRRALGDASRASAVIAAVEARDFKELFSAGQSAALEYAIALTKSPGNVASHHVSRMRDGGLTDGEILEVNQVVAYFAYANRTVNGLGVTTDGDELGLSPRASDDLDHLEHH